MTVLYDHSVPVFLHYLRQAEGLVRRVPPDTDPWQARLAPGMFTAQEQFSTAIGFTLRVAFPLAGRAVPDVPEDGPLLALIDTARRHLRSLVPADFDAQGPIEHEAGFAQLAQEPIDFLRLFGLPNFFFHLSMGFAILRYSGIELGKADFDGLHVYPKGFRF